MFVAGRGAGKTKSGAEWVRSRIVGGFGHVALIAPTTYDARHVMVDGPAGIRRCCWRGDKSVDGSLLGVPAWEPSNRRLVWANGATATTFSAEEPERLRGPQHDTMWADEICAWQYPDETWDMGQFGLRLGNDPRALITTTPKPIPLFRELFKAPSTKITTATTYANRPNLAKNFFHQVIKKYEGTRLGRQELLGHLIEESEGALWNRELIEKTRIPVTARLPEFLRIAVAIDPATSFKPESAKTGIVVCGIDADDHGYTLADYSDRYTPDGWANRAIKAMDDWAADVIVAEGNQGGDMVRDTIQSRRRFAPVKIVHAQRAKMARAEPIAAIHEQLRIHHVGAFPELEDQMCTWEPLGDLPSPDHLDAMVWAYTELMLKAAPTAAVGRYRR
jgi:phage terminase large subunit-like protein